MPAQPTRRALLTATTLAASSLALAACGEVVVAGEDTAGEAFSVTDDQDREIQLAGPAQRAVIINSYAVEFAQAIGAGDRIVGVDRAARDRLPYMEIPGDAIIAEGLDQLNYEAIAELQPDVVIMPRNAVWQEAQQQLEGFDIPVVVATAWDTDVVDATISLLGDVFGLTDRAQEVLSFRAEIDDALAERLADIEPVSVYFETVEPYLTTLPGSGFHAMITAGGGENVFSDASGGDAQEELTVDPSEVVLRDPQMIIHEFEPSAEPVDRFEEIRGEIQGRPGWGRMSAVAEERIAVANGWATSALGKSIGALYLASWLHPQQMEGVDPDEYLRRWVEDFQRFDLSDPADYVQGPTA